MLADHQRDGQRRGLGPPRCGAGGFRRGRSGRVVTTRAATRHRLMLGHLDRPGDDVEDLTTRSATVSDRAAETGPTGPARFGPMLNSAIRVIDAAHRVTPPALLAARFALRLRPLRCPLGPLRPRYRVITRRRHRRVRRVLSELRFQLRYPCPQPIVLGQHRLQASFQLDDPGLGVHNHGLHSGARYVADPHAPRDPPPHQASAEQLRATTSPRFPPLSRRRLLADTLDEHGGDTLRGDVMGAR